MPPSSHGNAAPLPGAVEFARVLDILAQLRRQTTFAAQAMTICNEVARHYRCRQVSLGWQEGRYLRLKSLNERADFERKMDLVQQIEAAMEEAQDQDNEVRYPATGAGRQVTVEHETLARDSRTPFLASVPLRVNDRPCAVLLLQRDDAPFEDSELIALRLLADHVAAPLAEAHHRQRWIGHRLRAFAEARIAKVFGLDHFWTKVGVLFGALLLAGLLFVKVDYYIEGAFVLRAQVQAIVAAPFQGYVSEVRTHTGDVVASGQLLAVLDPRELLQQQSLLEAEIEQYARSQRDARHSQNLSQMQIADARRRQSEAALQQVRFRLANSRIVAPLSGTVVEDNDLPRRLGTPVQKGDLLLTISQLDRFYAEIAIKEGDIHLVTPAAGGRLLFLSAPLTGFPFAAVELEPAGQARSDGNVVIARAAFAGQVPAWWRPGLSGTAKLYGGRRSPAWILSHRFLDWLRYRLWW